MQTKNLEVCVYNLNFKSIKKSHLFIGLLISLLITISFSIISDFMEILNNANSNIIYVSNFKSDITKLSETVLFIENERKTMGDPSINSFGSDGQAMNSKEITPDLTTALISIADTNMDEKISNDEILELKVMRLDKDTLKEKLKTLNLRLQSTDCNLNHYLVITQGKYAGTVIYNGPFKFIDSNNKRYFGLDLYV
ncbi:hypothetical protein [Clostridium sp.]|uniref:hypothetical protein n=1 Tax=Clostridium sp. TaxID=1506 RepID=UPI00284AEBAF|nr:hypothetical protein [Clostridium sp.]MDR3597314.1 hypothetical protein [Clostridium sp.]